MRLGNELYGKWQVGYPTLDELPARTLAFSKAVRAVDPTRSSSRRASGPIGGEKWNAAQLIESCGDVRLSFAALHPWRPTVR